MDEIDEVLTGEELNTDFNEYFSLMISHGYYVPVVEKSTSAQGLVTNASENKVLFYNSASKRSKWVFPNSLRIIKTIDTQSTGTAAQDAEESDSSVQGEGPTTAEE